MSTQYVLQSLLSATSECTQESENSFGPISECRFDFTLFFEQVVLSAAPSVLFVLLAIPRLSYLFRQYEKTNSSRILPVKLVLTAANFLLQIVSLVLWCTFQAQGLDATISVAVLNVLTSILIVILSRFEHTRSVRPSTLLAGYLVVSCLLDCAQLRTLYLLENFTTNANIFAIGWVLRLMILVIESSAKTSYLKPEFQNLPPEATSGIINRSFLWWLNPLFSIGFHGIISQNDLFELDSDLVSENAGRKMREAWDKRAIPEGRFTLVLTLWRGLRRPYSYVILPRLCLVGVTFAQPFLITRVLSLLDEADGEAYIMRGYGLIGATALIYIGIAISSLLANHNLFRFITMFRGGMVTLIYDRTLVMREGGSDDSAAVSLMSNDVDTVASCLEELNEIWSRFIELVIGILLLTRQLGWVSIMPLIVVALSFGGTSVIATLAGNRQKEWSDATQKRITTTGSMLRDMGSLKMTGLTEVIGDIVQDERVQETKRLESVLWISVWKNLLGNIPVVIAPAATFGVYVIQAAITGSDSLSTVQAFTSLALINLVTYPAFILLAAGPNLAASIGCFDRIQNFLLVEPRVDQRLSSEKSSLNLYEDDPLPEVALPTTGENTAISLDNVSIRPAAGAEIVLENVSFSIKEGNLVMITGPVGVGKTTILKAMLGELPCDEGTVFIHSRSVAYCSQSPWLQNGTIKQAISGTDEDEVADETWYETVLEACALTKDLSRLPMGDQTIVGSRGATLSGGQRHRVALARALYSRAKTFLLDDVLSALDRTTEKLIAGRVFGDRGLFNQLGATVVMVTHSTEYLRFAHQTITISHDGKVLPQDFTDLRLLDTLLAKEDGTLNSPNDPAERDNIKFGATKEDVTVSVEANDLNRQSGDVEVYKYYFKSVGAVKFFFFLFSCAFTAFCESFSGIWLKWWSDNGGKHIGLYLTVYFLLGIGLCVGNGGYGWSISIWISPDTGRKLHRVLLQTVLKAPLSLFATTETGSLLNRFSQDMSLIEGNLAFGLLITFANLSQAVAAASLVAIGSPFVAITIPLFLFAVYLIQKLYLRTSRQLRFLDIETRTPVYSHFLETLEGLSTIRGFGWEDNFKKGNLLRLDDSQKPYYLLFCIQRWLALVLDLLVASMAVLVVVLALKLRKYTDPGLLGVSMNNVLTFNLSLSGFVTGWTVLETSLGAIARLRDFERDTEVEAKVGEDHEPPKDWPLRGHIQIENLTAAYNAASLALKDVNLTIKPGQKVAICGRTGSGKSTLLSTILRTLEISSGSIKIDNLDISLISRSTIRKRLVTVPQHAFQIPGTLRLNTDPFDQRSDEEIISALTKVQLWSVLVDRGGLDADFQLDSLSKGQQQQLALARALLQKSAVVLLDEVTSSIDADTHHLLRDVMREEFRDCTVITVAHRPETILEADVVAVLDGGRLAEFGVPAELMKNESWLNKLLESADL